MIPLKSTTTWNVPNFFFKNHSTLLLVLATLLTGSCRLASIDFQVFWDFLKWEQCCQFAIFYKLNSKKWVNFAMHMARGWQSFHFQNSQGPYKFIFFIVFAEPFLIHQRTIIKKIIKNKILWSKISKIWVVFFIFQNGQNGFWLVHSKKKIFLSRYLLIFSF